MFGRVIKFKNKKPNQPDLSKQKDELAELIIRKEILERHNTEANKALEEKRKSLNLDYKSCEKIEKEHFDKIDKMHKSYLDLIELTEKKNKEIKDLTEINTSLVEINTKVKKELDFNQDCLEKLKEDKNLFLSNFQKSKKHKEKMLSSLDSEISNKSLELERVLNELIKKKVELEETTNKINEENRVLSIRKKDLEIYELRLRKKYPEDIIILK